jgi:alpha-glucosidase (family GH31 glycosyl hydrolase)
MLPLDRGMYIEYPSEEKAYQCPEQFLFGNLFLGSPVTAPVNNENKTVTQTVWLPEGNDWYHFFTGEQYIGGQEISVESPLDIFPLFVKGGYPIPMQPYTDRMASTPINELIIRCYPGKIGEQNSYTLYEDDGLTTDYQKGKFATTELTYSKAQNETTITISPTKNSYEGQLTKRSYRIELPKVNKTANVLVDGKKVKPIFNNESNELVILIKSTDIRRTISVKIL